MPSIGVGRIFRQKHILIWTISHRVNPSPRPNDVTNHLHFLTRSAALRLSDVVRNVGGGVGTLEGTLGTVGCPSLGILCALWNPYLRTATDRSGGHTALHRHKCSAKLEGQKIEKLLYLKKLYGAPGEIRTPDLTLRRRSLYPAELRARISSIPHFRNRGRDQVAGPASRCALSSSMTD